MVDESDSADPGPAQAAPEAGSVRWRVLEALIRKGDGEAVSRILSQSGERPGAGEFAYWSRLSLPDHPTTAHLLADYALNEDIALPAAHLAKAHASLATGDADQATEHYDLARGIEPGIWDPALEGPPPSTPDEDRIVLPRKPEPTHELIAEIAESEIDTPELTEPIFEDAGDELESESDREEEFVPAAESEHALADGYEDAAHASDTLAEEFEEWLEDDADAAEALDAAGGDDTLQGSAEIPLKPDWHLTSVMELIPHPPLVDPNLIPPTHRPAIKSVDKKPAILNYSKSDPDLKHTRHVPLVPKADPGVEDHPTLPGHENTDQFLPEPVSEEVVLLVADPGVLPKLPERNDTKEKISATLTTTLVHIALFILLALLIIAIPDPKPPEIIATTTSQTQTDSVRKKISRSVRGNPSPPSQSSMAVLATSATSQVVAPTVEFELTHDNLNLGSSFGNGAAFGGGLGAGGAFGVPAAMKSRCSPKERQKMLAKHGGSAVTERTIVRGLAWIAQQQNKDGSWGKKYKCAMTGLALLAFLGHCETPDSPRYGNRVMRGILYLVEVSKKRRIYASSSGHSAAYEHGIATYALGESYAIARLGKRPLPGMRDAFVSGTQTIINGQNPDGGWSYGYPKKGASDISVTGWQYQALKAAKHTKIKIEGLDASIEKAQTFLARVQDRNSGGFPYRPGQAGKRSLTSAGVLGLQMLGAEQKYAENIERGLRFALEDLHEQNWENANMYTWYYNTQACFQFGGNPWQHWNKMFSNQLTLNQGIDGAWDGAGGNHAGPDATFYSSCLAVLMLEVYYRYLPASG